MAKVFFKEVQRYDNYFALSSLGILGLGAIIGGIVHLLAPQPNYFSAALLIGVALIVGAGIWWLTRLTLKVTISEKGIKFKLSPIQPKKKLIPWKKIDSCMIVKTPEAAQWCGGNITFNHEKRVSLNGRNGLEIHTKEGENLFIGVKKVEGLRKSLDGIHTKLIQQ